MNKEQLLKYLDEHIPDDTNVSANITPRNDFRYVQKISDEFPHRIEMATWTEITISFKGLLDLPITTG